MADDAAPPTCIAVPKPAVLGVSQDMMELLPAESEPGEKLAMAVLCCIGRHITPGGRGDAHYPPPTAMSSVSEISVSGSGSICRTNTWPPVAQSGFTTTSTSSDSSMGGLP